MLNQRNIYQDILREISLMPNFLLEETLRSLKEIREAHEEKQKRVESILAFAGSWSDMSSGEFDDMMGEMKRTRDNLFNREIEF